MFCSCFEGLIPEEPQRHGWQQPACMAAVKRCEQLGGRTITVNLGLCRVCLSRVCLPHCQLYHAGVNVGVVLFDVGLVTSSRALAAGLDIPSLTYSNQSCPDSPAGRTNQPVSPTAAATGRNSPFAQLAVQHGLAQHGAAGDIQPSTPSTAQSMGSKLVGSISQALVGALLGLETRDRVSEFEQGSSSSGSPKRLGAQSRSLDCSPTRQAVQQPRGSPHAIRSAAGQKAAVSAAGVGAGGGNSSSRDPTSVSLHRRRSTAQHVQQAANVEQPQSLPTGLLRSSTGMSSGLATAPLASERASFSAWGQAPPINGPLTAGRPIASASGHAAAGSSAAAAVQGAQRIARSISANGMGHLTRSSSTTGRSGSPQTAAAADSSMQGSPSSRASRAEDRRPSRLTVPAESSSSGSTSPNPGRNRTLSPLTEARARLRLPRPQAQPLPPLAQLFSHTSTQPDGLIPVGRAPASPAGYSEATTARFSCGTAVEMSADYDALLREFDAADAAGKEAILFRELMQQQQERQAGRKDMSAASCCCKRACPSLHTCHPHCVAQHLDICICVTSKFTPLQQPPASVCA